MRGFENLKKSLKKGEKFLHNLEHVGYLYVTNLKFGFVVWVVKFLVVNMPGGSVRLSKGEVKANFDSVEKFDEGDLKINCACGKKHLDFGGLDIRLKESGEQ